MDPYLPRGSPVSGGIYADLQRELKEIDEILYPDGHGGRPSKDGASDYEPMAKLDDGSVGNETAQGPAGTLWPMVSVALIIIFIFGLLRTLAYGVMTALDAY
jgi:hypothetical protein